MALPEFLKEMGLGGLPEKEQGEMTLAVGRLLFESVLARALQELQPAEREELGKLLEKKQENDLVLEFLKARVPDLDKIAAEETEKLKQEIKEVLGVPV